MLHLYVFFLCSGIVYYWAALLVHYYALLYTTLNVPPVSYMINYLRIWEIN